MKKRILTTIILLALDAMVLVSCNGSKTNMSSAIEADAISTSGTYNGSEANISGTIKMYDKFTKQTYVPGVYSSTLMLDNSAVEVQIAVDKNHINDIDLSNLGKSITTLYPLISPTFAELSAVILSEQSLENVSYNDENRYTTTLLMQAITTALDKACVSENDDKPDTGIIY